MWIVNTRTGAAHHFDRPELAPGDAPFRIVRRGDKLVLWGYKTFVLDPASKSTPQVLVKDSWIFIPSAVPDRVWVGILDPNSPETIRGLKAVREVSVDGTVTVSDTPPPGGRWPVAALDQGLVFEAPDGGLEIWDPSTGRTLRKLPGEFVVASDKNVLAWCADPCDSLHLTNVANGEDSKVNPPEGTTEFTPYHGVFSPDGNMIAIPMRANAGNTNPKWKLALLDVQRGGVTVVDQTATQGDYVFVDWAPSGNEVFMSGANASGERAILEYDVSSRVVKQLAVHVGDFFGMAAA